MLTAKGLSWLAYRQELRATMSDEQLALLDANMPKTLDQSCVDMGVDLLSVQESKCAGIHDIEWLHRQDAPDCFTPMAELLEEFSLGLAALEDWCDNLVVTEEDQELDMF